MRRLTEAVISYKDMLFHFILLPMAVISVLYFWGILSSASATVEDASKHNRNQAAGKSASPDREKTVYLKDPLLKSPAVPDMNEERSVITGDNTDKLLTHILEKEVRDFYLPRLVMLFNDMNSILGIEPSIHGQKEKSEQVKEVIEENENFKISGQESNERQFPVKKNSTNSNEFYVQVGTWKNPDYAQKMLARVKKYYPGVYMVVHNNFNKVRIPGVISKKHAYMISRDIEAKFNMKALPVKKTQ